MKNHIYTYVIICFFWQNDVLSQTQLNSLSHFSSSENVTISKIVCDLDDNYFCIGSFKGELDIITDNNISSQNSDAFNSEIFISKFDTDDNLLWFKILEGPNSEYAGDICINSQNDLLITGYYRYDVDFDPSENEFILSTENWWEPFVLKLDTDGNFIWAKNLEGRGIAFNIETDNFDNIIVSGWFDGMMDFNPGMEVDTHESLEEDIFIVKLDNDGSYLWANRYGSSQLDLSISLTVDSNNDIITTGWFSDTIQISINGESETFIPNGSNDAYILKLGVNGDTKWFKYLASDGQDKGTSITTDSENNIYGVMRLRRTESLTTNFDGLNLTSNPNNHILFLKLDSEGNIIWNKVVENDRYIDASDIILDQNNLYATGISRGNTIVKNEDQSFEIEADMNGDGFLLKLTNDGKFRWMENFSSDSISNTRSIAINSADQLHISGYFENGLSVYDTEIQSSGDQDAFVVKVTDLVSSTDIELSDNFKIYPNPTQLYITIESEESISSLVLIDLQGRSFQPKKIGNTYNISNLPQGIYYCKINNSKLLSTPVVVSR